MAKTRKKKAKVESIPSVLYLLTDEPQAVEPIVEEPKTKARVGSEDEKGSYPRQVPGKYRKFL